MPNNKVYKNHGFTLVEMMVVIAIVGITSTIALTEYRIFSSKSRRAVVLSVISGVITAQKSYFGEEMTFGNTFSELNFFMDGFMSKHICDGDCGKIALDSGDDGEIFGYELRDYDCYMEQPAAANVTIPRSGWGLYCRGNIDNDIFEDQIVAGEYYKHGGDDTVDESFGGECMMYMGPKVHDDDISDATDTIPCDQQ